MYSPILNAEDFKKLSDQNDVWITDTRKQDQFTEGFVPGSVFVGLGERFDEWVKKILPSDKKFIIVTNKGEEEISIKHLQDAGFSVIGFLEGGFETWKKANKAIDMIIDIEADEFAMDIPFDKKMVIVDVRSAEEYGEAHVKNAINIPLEQISDPVMIASFEEDDNLYIHCAEGYRSIIACSLLKREGIHNLRNISGGFKEIKTIEKISLEKEKEISKKI